MGTFPFDTLSLREKEVLRARATGREGKEIALLLQIEHETVRSHLRSIRRKLATSNSAAAARAFIEHETATPCEGMPHQGGGFVILDWPSPPTSDHPDGVIGQAGIAREDRAIFDWQPAIPTETAQHAVRQAHGVDRLKTVQMIVTIAVGIIILVLAASPLADGFNRLATMLLAYKPH